MARQVVAVDHRFTGQQQINYIREFERQNAALIAAVPELSAENDLLERQFLDSNYTKCPLPLEEEIRDNIAEFRAHQLASEASYKLYDYNVMRAIKCTIDAFIYESANDDFPTAARYWLRDLYQIGEQSAEGAVYNPRFFRYHPFVIKTARDPRGSLQHEFAVGTVLNGLRRWIPNFMFTYSGFECSPPIEDTSGRVKTWCRRDGRREVSYLLLENVAQSVSMAKYIRDPIHTFAQILEKLVQVMLALAVARQRTNFSHFDLHAGNVLIRQVDVADQFQIQYQINDDEGQPHTVALRTDAVATIIDYGFSTIQLPTGQQIGRWPIITLTIPPVESFPLYDIYRFVMACLIEAYNHRPRDVFPLLAPVFGYFNPSESFQQYIQTYGSSLATVVPFNEATDQVTFVKFLRYLASLYPREINAVLREDSLWEGVVILGCANDLCDSTPREALADFGLVDEGHHDPLVDLYQRIRRNFDLEDPGQYPAVRATISPETYHRALEETIHNEGVAEHHLAELVRLDGELPEQLAPRLDDPQYVTGYLSLLRVVALRLKDLTYIVRYAQVARELLPVYMQYPEIVTLSNRLIESRNTLRRGDLLSRLWEKIQHHESQILAARPANGLVDQFSLIIYSINHSLEKILGFER